MLLWSPRWWRRLLAALGAVCAAVAPAKHRTAHIFRVERAVAERAGWEAGREGCGRGPDRRLTSHRLSTEQSDKSGAQKGPPVRVAPPRAPPRLLLDCASRPLTHYPFYTRRRAVKPARTLNF